MSPFIEGLIAGYGIAMPVGAVAVLIVNTAIRCGFRVGCMAGAGAATADFLYAVLASVAGAVLTALLQPIAAPLRLLGGLVLIGIACAGLVQGLREKERTERPADTCAPLRMYLQFVGITIINPLTVIYFAAFVLGRSSPAVPSLTAPALFVLGVGLSSLSWQVMLAAVGGVARNRLSPRLQRLTTVLGNLLVVAMGARILVSALCAVS